MASSSGEERGTSHQTRHYRCDICGASRSKRSLILSHMQKDHPHSLSEFSVVGKDSRLYKCPICGDSRSKLVLLRKHLQVAHVFSPQAPDTSTDSPPLPETRKRKLVECEECGRLAKKPSLLRQHMLAHAEQRPYACHKDGCGKSFKRPYHLKRHLLQHEEKAFLCPWPSCIMLCSNEYNLHRHLHKHELKGDLQRGVLDSKKVLRCPEPGCGAIFEYPCRLQSHCDTAHGLPYADIRCGESDCGQRFANEEVLLQHIRDSHNTVVCHVCLVSLSRKSLKRHVAGHEVSQMKQRLACPFDGCTHSFANSSNLSVHLRVCHLRRKEFRCTFLGCGKVFGYRHTRDNHEKSRFHCYIQGNFEEEDRKFQAGCRGGRKPVTIQKVEDLCRKRVSCPKQEQE